jgi:hypothetical protein
MHEDWVMSRDEVHEAARDHARPRSRLDILRGRAGLAVRMPMGAPRGETRLRAAYRSGRRDGLRDCPLAMDEVPHSRRRLGDG